MHTVEFGVKRSVIKTLLTSLVLCSTGVQYRERDRLKVGFLQGLLILP